MKQLFFEDVEVGAEIPPLVKGPISLTTLVKFAAATGDFAPVNHDVEYARSMGMPTAIIHGPMKVGYLRQLITGWIGEDGTLKRLDLRIRRAAYPGDVLTSGGKVTKKYTQDGENYIECEVWVENPREKSITGMALMTVPSRKR